MVERQGTGRDFFCACRLGDEVRSGRGVGDQSCGFRSCLVDVDCRRLGRRWVERVWSPEAAEAQNQRLAWKAARCVLELFDGVRRTTLEREGDAFDDESCCVACFGGRKNRTAL